MASKSAGFTKAAQNQKFVRNRDVKLKDRELRKEAHISKTMSEGICAKCRQIVQWKFHYDKYKPLKKVANCSNCKQKVVTKAYRTLCDPCARMKKVCPGCCKVFDETAPIGEAEEEEEDHVDDKESNDQGIDCTTSGGKPLGPDTVFTSMVDAAASEVVVDEDSGDGDDDDDEEEEEVARSGAAFDLEWDEKKFSNLAATKYSKSRVVGSETDIIL